MDQIVSDEIIIKREDLIDKYVGWTIPKTKNFLDLNLGKTIKITDKLIVISDDIAGIESMNEIKLFLSKHPDQIIYHMDEVVKGYNFVWNNYSTDYFKIVTRSDLTDKYVGHSKIKTHDLLVNNIGKTLLIVGKFVINERDGRGVEAMNEINDFLTKHPYEIVIKINGTKIEPPIKDDDDNHNVIKVRRHHLIDLYVGWSYAKTTNFLSSNLNKTIIIMDDLITCSDDPFGKEIEKSINDFLISNPGKIKIKYNNRPNNSM